MRHPLLTSLVSVILLAGCKSNQHHTDIVMGDPAKPGEHEANRHVELLVRDATTAGLSDTIVGHACRVQFRRDALGMAGDVPVGVMNDWNKQTTISGKIVEMTDQWLVIGEAGKRYCIPHAAILMIEVQD